MAKARSGGAAAWRAATAGLTARLSTAPGKGGPAPGTGGGGRPNRGGGGGGGGKARGARGARALTGDAAALMANR